MKPRPEDDIDMLIATEIMGWTILSHWEPGVVKHLLDENGCEVRPPEFKPYSTDIAAAYEVMEKLSENFADVSISVGCKALKGQRYVCKLTVNIYAEYIKVADTAPMAICLAALETIE